MVPISLSGCSYDNDFSLTDAGFLRRDTNFNLGEFNKTDILAYFHIHKKHNFLYKDPLNLFVCDQDMQRGGHFTVENNSDGQTT